MASHPAEPILGKTSEAPAQAGLLWRFSALAALFAIELLIISARTPHAALQGAPGLPGIVFSLGPWKVRLLVTLAVVSLLFWQVRGKANTPLRSLDLTGCGIAWRWLLGHLAAMVLCAALTSLLFENRLPGLQADLLVIGWTAVGAVGLWLGAIAFLPVRFWKAMLKGTGDVWLYVAALVVGACVFATYATRLWQPLAKWTLMLASIMLRPFPLGVTVNLTATMLAGRSFAVKVAPACSGYEGIGLILAFTGAWLWFFRREWRFPHALLLIPAGVATMWIFNATRVAALFLIGVAGAPNIALGGFHSHAGWIGFNIVALGTCLAARRIPYLNLSLASSGATSPLAERSERNPTVPYLMPFLLVLAAGMLSGAASSGFEWFYVLRVASAAAALWYFRDRYRTLDWTAGWSSIVAGGLVFLLWIGLELLLPSTRTGEPLALAQASEWARILWFSVRIFGAVVTVPIAEELAFRGFLLRRLSSADFESVAWRGFSWAPFLISSIAFGLLHGERWLAGTVAGMIYALAMRRRGAIGQAVAAHAVTNALLAVYVLTTGNWQLW